MSIPRQFTTTGTQPLDHSVPPVAPPKPSPPPTMKMPAIPMTAPATTSFSPPPSVMTTRTAAAAKPALIVPDTPTVEIKVARPSSGSQKQRVVTLFAALVVVLAAGAFGIRYFTSLRPPATKLVTASPPSAPVPPQTAQESSPDDRITQATQDIADTNRTSERAARTSARPRRRSA